MPRVKLYPASRHMDDGSGIGHMMWSPRVSGGQRKGGFEWMGRPARGI